MFRQLGFVLLTVSALPAVLSVVVHLTTPWTRTRMGRHLMAYAAAIAAVLVTWTVGFFFQSPPWFDIVRLAVFSLVPVVLWWRLWMQVQARRTKEKCPKRVDREEF